MTAIAPAPARTRAPRTARVGGVGLVAAAVVQLVAVVRFLVPSVQSTVLPLWQLVGWLVGAAVLLAASTVLALGLRGEPGVVGRSRVARAALIVPVARDPLTVLAALVALTTGTSGDGGSLVVVQLLVLAASTASAAAAVRARVLRGAARWALVPAGAVDAVALLVLLTSSTSVLFLACAYVARPLALGAGGLLLLGGTRRRRS